MRIDDTLDANGITGEISRRFKLYRIAYPLTQEDLAEKSMVSLSTIRRFEKGEDIGFSKLVRLLEALDIQAHLEVLIPDQSIRPSYFLEDAKPRKRARKKAAKKTEWKWGDEE